MFLSFEVMSNSYSFSLSLKKCLSYPIDGTDSQFLFYLYPSPIIFYPCHICFICGTLEMALILIFYPIFVFFPLFAFLVYTSIFHVIIQVNGTGCVNSKKIDL